MGGMVRNSLSNEKFESQLVNTEANMREKVEKGHDLEKMLIQLSSRAFFYPHEATEFFSNFHFMIYKISAKKFHHVYIRLEALTKLTENCQSCIFLQSLRINV